MLLKDAQTGQLGRGWRAQGKGGGGVAHVEDAGQQRSDAVETVFVVDGARLAPKALHDAARQAPHAPVSSPPEGPSRRSP